MEMTDREIAVEYLLAKKNFERWRTLHMNTASYRKSQCTANIGMGVAIALGIPAGILLARFLMSLIVQ